VGTVFGAIAVTAGAAFAGYSMLGNKAPRSSAAKRS